MIKDQRRKKQSAFYHFMQSQKNNSNSVMSVKALLENDEEYRSKIEFVYSQYNFNGEHFVNDKEMLERLKSFVPLRLSPTKFECYNGCHFKYFCSECLKIVQRERVELNPVFTDFAIPLVKNIIKILYFLHI